MAGKNIEKLAEMGETLLVDTMKKNLNSLNVAISYIKFPKTSYGANIHLLRKNVEDKMEEYEKTKKLFEEVGLDISNYQKQLNELQEKYNFKNY